MLPTIANPAAIPEVPVGVSPTVRGLPVRRPENADLAATTPGRPCRSRAVRELFAPRWDPETDRGSRVERAAARAAQQQAAAWCDRCPLSTACLVEALKLDAAYRRGDDPYGISGVCGGVLFQPGMTPQPVPHGPVAA